MLVDLLERLGHQPVLSIPKQTKAIATARLKNDRVDAERLVLLLRSDLLPGVWIPPTALREARQLRQDVPQLVDLAVKFHQVVNSAVGSRRNHLGCLVYHSCVS